MRVRVCVAGATGWVGKDLCRALFNTTDLELVGAVARKTAGKKLGDVIGAPEMDVLINKSVSAALDTPTDVLVDYTHAEAVKSNALTAIQRGVHVVIGSSGLSDEDFAAINSAAHEKRVGVIAAGNFALTAVLMMRFAREAARYLSQWEIIEYFAANKPDAPSGTTRELAYRLAEIKKPTVTIPIEKTLGDKTSRGATVNGSPIHAIRLPSFSSSVEIIFGAPDERLTIRFDAGNSSEPYLQGTLLAIRKVKDYVGLIRGLDNILD